MSTAELAPVRAATVAGAADATYLSVVAAARNDDHGGALLERMQLFVNTFLEQCARHRLDAELILVDWNPPEGRPALADALTWPRHASGPSVRVISVRPDLHDRVPNADKLAFFQMIAKNVGIRRARGRFVLATNVDLLFSDELMRFLSARRLRSGRVYRANRHDVAAGIPHDAGLAEQLEFCAANVIRICRRRGTIDLRTGEFYPIYPGPQYVPEAVARFWMRLPRRSRRVVEEVRRAAVIVRLATLVRVRRLREAVRVRLLRLWQAAALRARRWAAWIRAHAARRRRPTWRDIRRNPRRALERTLAHRRERLERRRLRRVTAREAAQRRRALHAEQRRQRGLEREAERRRKALAAVARREQRARARALRQQQRERERARIRLHTNACGDFTLMSREDWFRLRGYPELPIFSLHIDSLLLYMAHWTGLKEKVLRHPVYHVEHDAGFRPDEESRRALYERLDRCGIPQLTNEEFSAWSVRMWRDRRAPVLNDDLWGFVAETLPERRRAL